MPFMKSVTKRVLLFILLNAAVIVALSLVIDLFGIRPYLDQSGMDYRALLIFCLVWGMTGAMISLWLSRLMAKWMMGVEVIDADTTDPQKRQLLQLVHDLVRKAGLEVMPEVGIYDSDEVNAFATGPTRKRALVAVSSGLLRKMDWREIEGVLGHEISHVANGDMVTMTLLQGVVNAFVMFLARIIAYVITTFVQKREEGNRSFFLFNILVFVFQIFFMILGALIIAWFSRVREYRADQGGARLAGKNAMIGALEKLQAVSHIHDKEATQSSSFQALMISTPRGFIRFFSSHPPLEERIIRLEKMSEVNV
jgi:heat shock protein HtpX